MNNNKLKKIILSDKDMPTSWYNIVADMPNKPEPALHPATKKNIKPDDLSSIFPMELIKQEASTERFIEIPEEVLDVLRLWRPSPMYRAFNLEKILATPAHIYYKYEGVSPAGSHKPNTAVPQAYYNYKEGIKRITTETGAGQWGSSLAFAGNIFGIAVKVYMVRSSYEQKPYRRTMMETWKAQVIASPSLETESGIKILEKYPNCHGSLGIAISEAVEEAVKREDTNYALGSVLNHVLLHQTIIGLEAKKQMEIFEEEPDMIIACHGGGSNFAGISFPFIGDKIKGNKKTRFIAVEPTECPTLTKGEYRYDFGDTAGYTPLLKMYTLGKDFVPSNIHAGGLRYHGASPLVSQLLNEGFIESKAITQADAFGAAMVFARTEGIIPAPESSHAIGVAIDEAVKCRTSGEKKVILFNLSGHGHFDMSAYDSYLKRQ